MTPAIMNLFRIIYLSPGLLAVNLLNPRDCTIGNIVESAMRAIATPIPMVMTGSMVATKAALRSASVFPGRRQYFQRRMLYPRYAHLSRFFPLPCGYIHPFAVILLSMTDPAVIELVLVISFHEDGGCLPYCRHKTGPAEV